MREKIKRLHLIKHGLFFAWCKEFDKRVGGKMKKEDRYDSLIKHYAEEYDHDWLLIKAQIKQESAFDPSATSPVTAAGLAQFMPVTFKEWAYDRLKIPHPNPFNPEHSIHCQCAYMRWLLDTYHFSLEDALRSYNWGMGNVLAWIKGEKALPKETKEYTEKIFKYYGEYCNAS